MKTRYTILGIGWLAISCAEQSSSRIQNKPSEVLSEQENVQKKEKEPLINTSQETSSQETSVTEGSMNARSALFNTKPNIVYILADDLGYTDIGCYNSFKIKNQQHKIETPNIDALCAEGVMFTNHYSGAPSCAPSRSTLLTGQHTGHTRVRDNGKPAGGVTSLLPEDKTIGEIAKSQGYRTGLIGKWGVSAMNTSGMPLLKGFDYFFGFIDQVEAHFYYPPKIVRGNNYENIPSNQNGQEGVYIHDAFTSESLEFIKREKNNPFMLQLWYTIPHAELKVPQDSRAPYEDKWGPETPWYTNGHYPTVTKPHATYAGMISRMDRDIGLLKAELQRQGVLQNTLIVFASDNGASKAGGIDHDFFNGTGPFKKEKFSLYEGGIRTPMIASWPHKFNAKVIHEPVSMWDFFATTAELIGASVNNQDGKSLAPLLTGEAQTLQRDYLYWEIPAEGAQALRQGEWKILRLGGPQGTVELYNIVNDPGEINNMAAFHPDIVNTLLEKMRLARTKSTDHPSSFDSITSDINTNNSVNIQNPLLWAQNKIQGGAPQFLGQPTAKVFTNPVLSNCISGTPQEDFFDGTENHDCYKGLDGNDYIQGAGGNDILLGGPGNDDMYGNLGSDIIYGGAGDDNIRGGKDHDFIFGDLGNDTLNGDLGDDYIIGMDGDDQILGGDGNDDLYGHKGKDSIFGGNGNDIIYGGQDDDNLYGNEGDDFLLGDSGNDQLYGGKGNDQLIGGEENDVFYGDDGNDFLFGGKGADILYGNKDQDVLYGDDGDDQIYGGQGDDWLIGGLGNDFLSGDKGNDILEGGEGNDTYFIPKDSGITVIYNDNLGSNILKCDQISFSQDKKEGNHRILIGQGVSIILYEYYINKTKINQLNGCSGFQL